MSTLYHSTRSNDATVTSTQAIIAGIAPDGGLYVSDALGETQLDLTRVCGQSWRATCNDVLNTLVGDLSAETIARCVDEAYASFTSDAVTPVSAIGNDWLLELYHGPTCAFKDVALQMLPRLMTASLAHEAAASGSAPQRIMILTATSGDTGKAALAGFADVEGIGCTVFFPAGGVSDVQRLQMVTQPGANVAVAGIHGNFDDAQTTVKRIFGDRALAERLAEQGMALSSANSINVGRLVPQVVYYFDAYAQLVRSGAISCGDEVDFCVPTGNFGDVLAGYYAKQLGLPVHQFVVASNTNDVLTEFLTTGRYNRVRPFEKTISPSMDILVSSNLERLLYYASGRDCELVAQLMRSLDETGEYQVPAELFAEISGLFRCGSANDDETRSAIARAWQTDGRLIDPHTAVGKHVLDTREGTGHARVLLSTASPYKFSPAVLEALGESTEGLSGFDCMDRLEALTNTQAPAPLAALREAPVRFRDEIEREAMPAYVEDACKRLL